MLHAGNMAGVIRLFLTACSLKTLSILSLLELLLGKDLSHIKVLSFGTLSLKNLKALSPRQNFLEN